MVTKGIGLVCKLQPILPQRSLLIIYKSFVRPHLDLSNNAALAITGAIKGSSYDKLYNKLGLTSNKVD